MQGFGREALGDRWSGMLSNKSHKCSTVSGRLPLLASLTVLKEESKLKKQMLKQPVKTRSYSSIQFLQKEFYFNFFT